MLKEKCKALLAIGLALFLFMGLTTMAWSMGSRDKVPRISKEEVKDMLGAPDLVVLDVRTSSGYKSSKLKIQGAIREEPEQVKSWAGKYGKEKTVILYCS